MTEDGALVPLGGSDADTIDEGAIEYRSFERNLSPKDVLVQALHKSLGASCEEAADMAKSAEWSEKRSD